jgi:hypothetical protein
MSMSLVRLPDLPQYVFVCLVQAVGQLLQDAPDSWWETVPQDFQLTENPSEPILCFEF